MRSLAIVTTLFVAMAMSLAMTHALELPGKLRLSRDEYQAVQAIYYPGFTYGGIAEPVSVLLLLGLVVLTPVRSDAYWPIVAAFVAMLAMHGTFWLFTQPVNNFWVKGFNPRGAGGAFLRLAPFRRAADPGDWTRLRNQWEGSHLVRAAFALASLVFLLSAVVKMQH